MNFFQVYKFIVLVLAIASTATFISRTYVIASPSPRSVCPPVHKFHAPLMAVFIALVVLAFSGCKHQHKTVYVDPTPQGFTGDR